MNYTPTDEEQAFVRAYQSNVAVASLSDVLYFLANKEKVQDVDYEEEQKIVDCASYWSHIEDAWLMWRDAMNYAKETTHENV